MRGVRPATLKPPMSSRRDMPVSLGGVRAVGNVSALQGTLIYVKMVVLRKCGWWIAICAASFGGVLVVGDVTRPVDRQEQMLADKIDVRAA